MVPAAAVAALAAGIATAVTAGATGDVPASDGRTAQMAAAAVSLPGSPADVRRRDPVDASKFLASRDEVAVSRSAPRVTLKKKPKVKDREFLTAPLNLWPAPREKGRPLAVLPERSSVGLTGPTRGAFAQILHTGQIRWVRKAYLVDTLPKREPARRSSGGTSGGSTGGSSGGSSGGGLSTAPCPDGSAIESGLTSSAVTLYRSVCNAFPALSTYIGYAPRGEHGSGRSIDFMTSDPGLGQAVADYVRANAGALNVYDVIWAQRIWTPARASEGWRFMSDRGSATANHYDHVHVATN